MADSDKLQSCPIPIRLSREDRAAMWLHEWQGRHCEKACGDLTCRLPSVMKVAAYCAVGHGTAARARRRIVAQNALCQIADPAVPNSDTVFEPSPCQGPTGVV